MYLAYGTLGRKIKNTIKRSHIENRKIIKKANIELRDYLLNEKDNIYLMHNKFGSQHYEKDIFYN